MGLSGSWVYLSHACQPKSLHGLPSWISDLHSYSAPEIGLKGIGYKSSQRQCQARMGHVYGQLIIRGHLAHTLAITCLKTPRAPISQYERAASTVRFETLYLFDNWECAARDAMAKLWHMPAQKDEAAPRPVPEGDIYWSTPIGGKGMCKSDCITQEIYECFKATLKRFICYYEKVFEVLRSEVGQGPSLEINLGAPFTSAKPSDNILVTATLSELEISLQPETELHTWVKEFLALEARLSDEKTLEGRLAKHLKNLGDRNMFFTSDGRAGLATQQVRAGDVVCVFNGAPTPHVLRRVPDQANEVYTLVDEVYVHVLWMERSTR